MVALFDPAHLDEAALHQSGSDFEGSGEIADQFPELARGRRSTVSVPFEDALGFSLADQETSGDQKDGRVEVGFVLSLGISRVSIVGRAGVGDVALRYLVGMETDMAEFVGQGAVCQSLDVGVVIDGGAFHLGVVVDDPRVEVANSKLALE
jgi:hypothetical protein